MSDVTKNMKKPRREDTFRNFSNEVFNSYETMKKHSNLEKTLVACHYIEKEKSEALKRCD